MTTIEATTTTPPSSAPKPGVWERLAGWFSKERETARVTYARLLRHAELDQKDLSDREVVELGEAMKAGEITKHDLAGHRDILRRYREAKAASDALPGVVAALRDATKKMENLDAEIAALQTRRVSLAQTRDDVAQTHSGISRSAGATEALEAAAADLFGAGD